jgi:hypothetical protein
MKNLSDQWRAARVDRYSEELDVWVVLGNVTIKPGERVYDLRRAMAKEERARLRDIRFVPFLDSE